MKFFRGDKLFLTNSYNGLKKDIDSINAAYDSVYMFGLDKRLKGTVRIDCVAQKDDVCLNSDMDYHLIDMKMESLRI